MAESKTEPREIDKHRHAIIAGHRSHMQTQRQKWARATKTYRSESFKRADINGVTGVDNDETLVVEHNWLYAFADTMVANICPTNPQVTVNNRRENTKEAARFQQELINDALIRDKAHEKLWKGATRTAMYGRCFFKAVWHKAKNRPVFRVISPEFVFYDFTAEEWDDARYIIEAVPMTEADLKARVGKKGRKGVTYRANALEGAKFGGYPNWLKPESDKDSTHGIAAQHFSWTVVYEYYDLVERKVAHYLENDPVPLAEFDLPYWYVQNNYAMLTFNDNLEDNGGLSDAALVMSSIDALNELSTLELWHNQASIPKMVVNENYLDNPDDFYSSLEKANTAGMAISLKTTGRVRIDEIMSTTPMPSLPVNWASSKDDLQRVIEFTLGLASYQRGAVGEADVATELALSDTAIRTRNARRQKAIYGVIEWMARCIVGLYQQYLQPEDEVALRLGMDEGVKLVTREDLGFPDNPSEDEPVPEPDPFGYDYVARAYNAQEGNSIAQLKMMTDYAELLLNNVNVDQRKFIEALLDKLAMQNLLVPKEIVEKQQQAAAQAQAAQAGGGGQGQPSADVPVVGAPADAQDPLQGGVVGVGNEAQRVAGGLEGGSQPGGGTV